MKKIIPTIMICLLTYTTANNASSSLSPPIFLPIKKEVIEVKKEKVSLPLKQIISEEYSKIKPSNPINNKYIDCIIRIESGYDSLAVGSSGERGLMQIMPDTWSQYTTMSFDSAFIQRYNINTGVKVLKKLHYLLKKEHPAWSSLNLKDQQKLIGAAYNGGYQRLKNANYDINNMPKRTQRYVTKL